MTMTTAERFWKRVEQAPGSCWLWQGDLNTKGYGLFKLNPSRQIMAHRYAYIDRHGAILHGLEVDHLCRVRHCVNPDHMELVDHRTNLLRGDTVNARAATRTHCPRGHLLAGDNLDPCQPNRACLTCRRERVNRWHREHREQLRTADKMRIARRKVAR